MAKTIASGVGAPSAMAAPTRFVAVLERTAKTGGPVKQHQVYKPLPTIIAIVPARHIIKESSATDGLNPTSMSAPITFNKTA